MKTATPETAARFLDLDTAWGNPGTPAAIYVHFPFCRHMCTYCDFDTFTGLEGLIDSYVDALVAQILASPEVEATSLYAGGGTPSIMTAAQASRVIQACVQRFGLDPAAEATVEANPTDMDPERLDGFRRAGFNRLSVGVQSTDARLLRLLGRRHSAGRAATAVQSARTAGFENISIDLIYGVPKQDLASWKATLGEVVGWGVDHVSAYMLTVEPGTPMERGVERGVLVVPEDEETVAMYEAAREYLASVGFQRYEISNWARPGRESRHNMTYWRNREYLAIGAGAAGYRAGTRYKLLPSVGGYIKGVRDGQAPLAEHIEVDVRRDMSDSVILGLRLAEGVSVEAFHARFGVTPYEQFGEPLSWAEENGLLDSSGGTLKLTEEGILLSNELFQRLL